MKSYHVNKGAGIAGLMVKEHDIPVPGPHEVLVRVQANSLNFRELSILRGYYPLPIRPDVVPVSDGAGWVVAVGSDVTRAKVGDRVADVLFPHWIDGPWAQEYSAQIGGSLDGMLTEYAVLSEEGVVHIPDHLSFEEAAALPCAGVTAWNALTGARPLQAGDTVLTQGSGGVSLFALQLAKLLGARVIATTSSAPNGQRLKQVGADVVVDYVENPQWAEAVRGLTAGRGVDRVVEVGGPGTLAQSLKAVMFGGEIAIVGALAEGNSGLDFMSLFMSQATLRCISVGSRVDVEAMQRAVDVHAMHPVIDSVFPFVEAKSAWAHYAGRDVFGKIVIRH